MDLRPREHQDAWDPDFAFLDTTSGIAQVVTSEFGSYHALTASFEKYSAAGPEFNLKGDIVSLGIDIIDVTEPDHGTAEAGFWSAIYTPLEEKGADVEDFDSFNYTIVSLLGEDDTATVTIEALPDEVSVVGSGPALEVPPHEGHLPEYVEDEATFTFKRERPEDDPIGLGHSTTVYFTFEVPEGVDPSEDESGWASSLDWSFKDTIPTFVGLVDIKGEDVPVWAIEILEEETEVDLTIITLNDSDYELKDEKLRVRIVNCEDLDHVSYKVGGDEEATIEIIDRTANIDIDGKDQVTEDDPGYELTINDDDDDEDGVPDFFVGFPGDELFIDDDLIEVTLESLIPGDMGFDEDYFKVAFDSSIVRLWFNQDKSDGPDGEARVTAATKFDESGGSHTIWIEGVGFGAGLVSLVWYESDVVESLGFGSVFDTFRYATIGIDVDIDSDNDDIIQHSVWEDELEDNLYGLGKLLKDNVTPLKFRVAPVVHSDSTLTFDYEEDSDAGEIILGTTPDHLGTWIRPGDTLLKRDFNVDADGWATIWVHVLDNGGAEFSGEAPGYGGLNFGDGTRILDRLGELKDQDKPEKTIKITLESPNGGESSDEVKYISIKSGILWDIQTRPELRHAFVSKAVYGWNLDGVDDPSDLPYDLPNYGLEWLSDEKLDEYELPERSKRSWARL